MQNLSHQINHPQVESASRYMLFIDSLHPKLTQGKVESALAKFGNLASIDLPKIKKGKKTILQGYGTLEVKDKLTFFNFLSQDISIKGKRIFFEPFDPNKDTIDSSHNNYLKRLIFVSNVPKKFSDTELKLAFQSHFGPVHSAYKSVTATGRVKPFGFVVFKDPQTAKICAESGVLIGENFAITVRRYEEDKPDESKKSKDKKIREIAMEIKGKKCSSKNSSNGIEENNLNDLRGNFEIIQDRRNKGSFENKASIDSVNKQEEEKSRRIKRKENFTQSTFPPSTVKKTAPYCGYRTYESDLSLQFEKFFEQLELQVNQMTQNHQDIQQIPLQFYENYYQFSNLYHPVRANYPYNLPQNRNADLNDEQSDDNSSLEEVEPHLKNELKKNIEKNHRFGNLRLNFSATKRELARRRNIYRSQNINPLYF